VKRLLTKIRIVILQPTNNPDLKDVILSVSEESYFLKKSKQEILHFVQDDKEGMRSFGLPASG
jgi:hypothetical protein